MNNNRHINDQYKSICPIQHQFQTPILSELNIKIKRTLRTQIWNGVYENVRNNLIRDEVYQQTLKTAL